MWHLDLWLVEQPNHLKFNDVYRKDMKGLSFLCPVFLSCRWIQSPTLTFACMTPVLVSLLGTVRVSVTPLQPTRTSVRRKGLRFTGGHRLCAVSTENIRQNWVKVFKVLAQTGQI